MRSLIVFYQMLAPVVAGGIGMAQPGTSMAPPTSGLGKTAPPIFGQSAKINIEPSLLPRATPSAPTAVNALGTNSFAALANVPGSTTADVVNGTAAVPGGASAAAIQGSTGSTNAILNQGQAAGTGATASKSPTKQDKVTDIDALKKKLAMMERETSRLR